MDSTPVTALSHFGHSPIFVMIVVVFIGVEYLVVAHFVCVYGR